jgi:hypothetical protein
VTSLSRAPGPMQPASLSVAARPPALVFPRYHHLPTMFDVVLFEVLLWPALRLALQLFRQYSLVCTDLWCNRAPVHKVGTRARLVLLETPCPCG